MIVVVAIILRCLANHRANARTSRSADNRPLQAAAKHRAQHRSAAGADQRSLPRPNPTLAMIVMIVIVTIAVVVVSAPAAATAHAVVVRAIVVLILLSVVGILQSHCRHHRSGKNKRSNKDRSSNLGHFPLDAGFVRNGSRDNSGRCLGQRNGCNQR